MPRSSGMSTKTAKAIQSSTRWIQRQWKCKLSDITDHPPPNWGRDLLQKLATLASSCKRKEGMALLQAAIDQRTSSRGKRGSMKLQLCDVNAALADLQGGNGVSNVPKKRKQNSPKSSSGSGGEEVSDEEHDTDEVIGESKEQDSLPGDNNAIGKGREEEPEEGPEKDLEEDMEEDLEEVLEVNPEAETQDMEDFDEDHSGPMGDVYEGNLEPIIDSDEEDYVPAKSYTKSAFLDPPLVFTPLASHCSSPRQETIGADDKVCTDNSAEVNGQASEALGCEQDAESFASDLQPCSPKEASQLAPSTSRTMAMKQSTFPKLTFTQNSSAASSLLQPPTLKSVKDEDSSFMFPGYDNSLRFKVPAFVVTKQQMLDRLKEILDVGSAPSEDRDAFDHVLNGEHRHIQLPLIIDYMVRDEPWLQDMGRELRAHLHARSHLGDETELIRGIKWYAVHDLMQSLVQQALREDPVVFLVLQMLQDDWTLTSVPSEVKLYFTDTWIGQIAFHVDKTRRIGYLEVPFAERHEQDKRTMVVRYTLEYIERPSIGDKETFPTIKQLRGYNLRAEPLPPGGEAAPVYIHPATLSMGHCSAIGAALAGQGWYFAQVQDELHTLLVGPLGDALDFVSMTRKKIKSQWMLAFADFKLRERRHFKENAYFKRRK